MARDPRFEELLSFGVEEPVISAMEGELRDAADDALANINPMRFAEAHRLEPNAVIGGFLRASKLGLFDQAWSIHCRNCRRRLFSGVSAHAIEADGYYCTSCDVTTESTLDEKVEITFAVNPRLRKLSAELTPVQVIIRGLSSAVPIDERLRKAVAAAALDLCTVKPGETRTAQFEAGPPWVLVNDMTLHGTVAFFLEGERAERPQELEVAFTGRPGRERRAIRPGPVALRIHNASNQSMTVLTMRPTDEVRSAFRVRAPFLGAKQLITHPVFRDLYRADALDVDQQLKLESLTVLFTDLKGSTELYERVGDLKAFELVRKHFDVLERAIVSQGGSIVKTIGDAVMATFTEPAAAIAAALQMREGLSEFNQQGASDLLIKIGLHDGPCLAVMLNERLDYFGQTVNVAARVQGLAEPQSILATAPVLQANGVGELLGRRKLEPRSRQAELKGIQGAVTVFEIA